MTFQRSPRPARMTRRHLLTVAGGAAAYPALPALGKPAPEAQGSLRNQTILTEISPKWIRVVFGGVEIADSRKVLLLIERGRTPVYYFPRRDVRTERLERASLQTHHETLGDASYYTLK